MGACAVRPQSLKCRGRGGGQGVEPQTAHTETHRLHSLIHLSLQPYLCFLAFPPQRATSGVTDCNLSIHLPVHSTLHQCPSIHPPHDLRHLPAHQSLSDAQHLRLVHTFTMFMPRRPRPTVVKTIICSDTSRLYLVGPLTPHRTGHPTLPIFPKCSPVPSRSSCLQTSDHRVLMGGLRGNSYHTAII